jgi:hypothetical protein
MKFGNDRLITEPPAYPLWRDFAYEYEQGKLAIDVINGDPLPLGRRWRCAWRHWLPVPDERAAL